MAEKSMGESPLSTKGKSAMYYADQGFPVFPCKPGRKDPLTTHGFHDASTNAAQIERWWNANPEANVAIPTAGLVVIDVDGPANEWPNDRALEEQLGQTGCPINITPRGGRHLIFLQPEGVEWKNTTSKLAPSVDTRATGGYILVPPSVVDSKRYRWADTFEMDGTPDELPLPPDWLIDELHKASSSRLPAATTTEGDGATNDILLHFRNDTLASLGGTMRRVGMGAEEILAALHTANRNRCKPPLDDKEVVKIAMSVSRYDPSLVAVAGAENHWAQMGGVDRVLANSSSPVERVKREEAPPIPDELLSIPGFVNDVADYTMSTAPYPNRVMAFAGALGLLSFLTARKVRDQGDNRTSLYILALAHSAAGKDWPRKINTRILHEIGLADRIGDRFASGEGLQDSLYISPSMLYQTDEIDSLLIQVNKSRDGRMESVMSTLLTMYSSSNTVFPMRRRAGDDAPRVIDQPGLTILGTAIPNHYYEALSERMLTNGFFARMLILENAKRGEGQEPIINDIPHHIIKVAHFWSEYRPGDGNLEDWHPVPQIVKRTDEATELLIAGRQEADRQYSAAERRGDAVGTTVWGRYSEQTRKLALIYAASVNHNQPMITLEAVEWASTFMKVQCTRMLWMATQHVSDNPFHASCLRAMKKIREAKDGQIDHSVLLKRMKTDSKTLSAITQTLVQQGDLDIVPMETGGRPKITYVAL